MVATDGCLWSVQKEFGEVMKPTKWSKLPDQEVKYDTDGETEIDFKYTKEQKEAFIKNRMAVTALTISFRDNVNQYCMNMVLDSKTTDLPSGCS